METRVESRFFGLMAAAGLDYYGDTLGPLTGLAEAERLEVVKLALALGKQQKLAEAMKRR
jgi:hypothetical protein